MTLGGGAAMILYYDILSNAVGDHDHWHTHEHIPERLSIPGFLRASRWVASEGSPRYLVIYEVAELGVLSGAPYRERLDHPTPWTARMMPNFRGMTRGFCRVVSSAGLGFGNALLSLRYSPVSGREHELRDWLKGTVLPAVCARRGLAGAWMLEPAANPTMTKEQEIRGKDADLPWVLLISGYSAGALSRIAGDDLATARLEHHGAAADPAKRRYRLDFLLSRSECTGA